MEQFLIKWKGRQSGPFTEGELREKLANREIKSMHEVQVDGEWKTIRAFLKERDKAGNAVPEAAPPEETPVPPAQETAAPLTAAPVSTVPEPLPAPAQSTDSQFAKNNVTIALGNETEGALSSRLEEEGAAPEKVEKPAPVEQKPEPNRLPESIEPKASKPERNLPKPDLAGDVVRQTFGGEFLVYAGFWNRLLALIADGVIVFAAPLWILGRIFEMPLTPLNPLGSLVEIWSLGALGICLLLLGMIWVWIYFAAMESSRKRATFGKQIFGLVVTTEDGERVSFQRATKRFFGKFLSGLMVFAGFFLAAFTRRKQAYHDILSRSTVNFAFPSYRLLKRRKTKSR